MLSTLRTMYTWTMEKFNIFAERRPPIYQVSPFNWLCFERRLFEEWKAVQLQGKQS